MLWKCEREENKPVISLVVLNHLYYAPKSLYFTHGWLWLHLCAPYQLLVPSHAALQSSKPFYLVEKAFLPIAKRQILPCPPPPSSCAHMCPWGWLHLHPKSCYGKAWVPCCHSVLWQTPAELAEALLQTSQSPEFSPLFVMGWVAYTVVGLYVGTCSRSWWWGCSLKAHAELFIHAVNP